MLNKFFKGLHILGLAAISALVFVDPAFASGAEEVFSKAKTKGRVLFENVQYIVFIVGGFGLVGLAFAAIFGKVSWKWFAALGTGLFILAVANSVVKFATNQNTTELKDTV